MTIDDQERKMYLDIIATQNKTIEALATKQDALTNLVNVLGPVLQKMMPPMNPPFGPSPPSRGFNLEDIFKKDTANPKPEPRKKSDGDDDTNAFGLGTA